jgi:hypothetical protein
MTRLAADVQRIQRKRGSMKARDGAIINVVVDDTTGTEWVFQLRKDLASPHKWVFIGGTDWFAFDGANYPTVGTGLNLPGTPALLVPFSGIFTASVQATVVNNTSPGTQAALGASRDGATTFMSQPFNIAGASYSAFITNEYPLDGQVMRQGETVQAAYQSNIAAVVFLTRMLKLRPRRIMI